MARNTTAVLDHEDEDTVITASPEIQEAIAAEEAASEPEPVVEVKTKPSKAVLKKAAEEQIAEAFEDLTTAYSQSGASVAAAESSAQAFVTGIAGLRAAGVSQDSVSKSLVKQAKTQGVEVPFSATGYITIAEVVAALLSRSEDGELGTVTRTQKGEDGKAEKYEANVIVRVDGFGGVKTGHDEVEVFSIVRAVTAPQGVAFLSDIPADEFGKAAALRIISEAEDVNAAVRELDKRGSYLKAAIARNKRVEKAQKKVAKEEPVTPDGLITDLLHHVMTFAEAIERTVEEGETVPVEQTSSDNLKYCIATLQGLFDNDVIEVIAAA